MGEAAEMLLDGILDSNGEYNENHRFSKWTSNANNHGTRVSSLLNSRCVKDREKRTEIVLSYGRIKCLDQRKFGAICKYICEEPGAWNQFRKYLDEHLKLPLRILHKDRK